MDHAARFQLKYLISEFVMNWMEARKACCKLIVEQEVVHDQTFCPNSYVRVLNMILKVKISLWHRN